MIESELLTRRTGYARVSAYVQRLVAQLALLRAKGSARINRKKASGAQPPRHELQQLLKTLAPADEVMVTRIGGFVVSTTFDLVANATQILDAGGQLCAMTASWFDTAASAFGLMIAVLGELMAAERDLIRTRTTDGRSHANLQGLYIGRPLVPTPRQRAEGAIPRKLAESYKFGRAAILGLSV